MNKYIKVLLVSFFAGASLFISCKQEQTEQSSEERIQGVKPTGSIADIIRIEDSYVMETDSSRAARFEFDSEIIDLGDVKQGSTVHHDLKFTNVGQVPMIISEVRSTCGCTVPEFPEDPIGPGEEGIITIKYSAGKQSPGKIDKPVTITANTWPGRTELRVQGQIVP